MEHLLLDDLLRREERSVQTVREVIIACRNAIREHSDARGDDRCWLDDFKVWRFVTGAPRLPVMVLSFGKAMRRCRAYHTYRGVEQHTIDSKTAETIIATRGSRDEYLIGMRMGELFTEAGNLHEAILVHSKVEIVEKRYRTYHDDRRLYSVLPEGIAADFWLPSEKDFLGEAKAPHAGCPSFWRSHARCPLAKHNLHQWGPCTEATLLE